MGIKEFVAYKFDDLDDIMLADSNVRWTPVFFPYYPERNLYFITMTISGTKGCFNPDERLTLKSAFRSNDFYISSIYDTCGYNPLLLLIEAQSPDCIKDTFTYNVHPRYISIATPNNIVKRFGINASDFNITKRDTRSESGKVAMKTLDQKIEELIKKDRFTKQDITEEFSKIDNWPEIVRFVPYNMSKIISIVLLQPPSIEVETEIIDAMRNDRRVLDIYRVVGESKIWLKIITDDILEIHNFIESFINQETHAIAKIVLCTFKENGRPFNTLVTPQMKTHLTPLKRHILRYLWNKHEVLFLSRNDQIKEFKREYRSYADIDTHLLATEFDSVENNFVYKYSIKLDRKGWFKTLLFVKSSLKGKKRLWNGIENDLLDATCSYFARKHYVVTGDFDFIIPIDFQILDALKDKISKFLSYSVDGVKMEEYATDVRAYFEDVLGSDELLDANDVAGIKAMMPNSKKSDKGAPREIYRRFYLDEIDKNVEERLGIKPAHNFQREDTSLIEIMKLVSAIPTIELHTEKLIHLFARFHVKDKSCFEDKLAQLKTDGNRLFLWKEYKPLHNPDTRMFIMATDNFSSLYDFIKSLDQCSRNTITSIIFTQGFYRPQIADDLRCKPCRLPLDSKCDACPQYVTVRSKTDIRDVNLKVEGQFQKCVIAVSQIQMLKLAPLLPWHTSTDKTKILKALESKVIGHLYQALESNSNIIVFPDFSVQDNLITDIIEIIKKKKVIVIAGTHFKSYEKVKDKYYLTCPVLISNGINNVAEYHIQKNTKSPVGEIEIERESNVIIAEGRGMLRFFNTGFGNFGVLICYDFLDDDMFDSLSDNVDFIIVPMWNSKSGLDRFTTQVGNAKNKRIIIIYSNNALFGESGLYGPYKQKYAEDNFKKGEEGIKYYNFDIAELDGSRDTSIWSRSPTSLNELEKTIKNKYQNPAGSVSIVPRYKNVTETT